MPPGPDRDQRELAILLKRGPAVFVYKGMQNPEAEQNYQRAYEISDECSTTITRCSRRFGDCGFAPICSDGLLSRAIAPKSWSRSRNVRRTTR